MQTMHYMGIIFILVTFIYLYPQSSASNAVESHSFKHRQATQLTNYKLDSVWVAIARLSFSIHYNILLLAAHYKFFVS